MPIKIDGAIRKDILLVPVSELKVKSEDNYRQDLGDLSGLASSIAQEGVLQPLRVKRGHEGQLELISGFRRFAAVQKLREQGVEVERVPCVFQDRTRLGEGDVLVAQLLENAHRKDATALERARAYDRLIRVIGLDVGEVSKRLGESEGSIRSYLNLLVAPTPIQKALEGGRISMTAANQIVKKAGDDEDKARELLTAAVAASGRGERVTTKGAKKAAPSDKPRRRTRGIAEVAAKIEELDEILKEIKTREEPNQAVISELTTVRNVLRWVAGMDVRLF